MQEGLPFPLSLFRHSALKMMSIYWSLIAKRQQPSALAILLSLSTSPLSTLAILYSTRSLLSMLSYDCMSIRLEHDSNIFVMHADIKLSQPC